MKLAIKCSLAVLITAAFSLSLGTLHAQSQAIYTAPTSDTAQDFHIDKDGYAKISQAKVFQIAGSTLYVRYYFGIAFIRLVVKSDQHTKVYRRYGDEITFSQIAEGDTLNIEGKIESGSDALSIVATKLTNFSNQKSIADFSGTVSGNGTEPGSFLLNVTNIGLITVNTGPATQIQKGSRTIGIDLVRSGDKVTNTAGTYDHATKKLAANVVVIYTDLSIYQPRNFEGTLKTFTSGTPPTIVFATEGKEYPVTLEANALILNNKRKTVSLQRFVTGDTIRVYGNIREAEEPAIDAEVIRNLDL